MEYFLTNKKKDNKSYYNRLDITWAIITFMIIWISAEKYKNLLQSFLGYAVNAKYL